MKYVIMCGGNYTDQFETPKPLLKVNNEILVERTIRLLKDNGIKDIAISTDIENYNYLNVEILKNKNKYVHDKYGNVKKSENAWLTAYYPLKENVTYLAGDIYWTDEAIKKIINIKKTMFICAPNVEDGRKHPSIKGREPLGYIVYNQEIFRQAINEMLIEIDEGKYSYDPIAWNLYRKLNNIPIDYQGLGNDIFKTEGDYLVIDDLTTDIDCKRDIPNLERLIRVIKGVEKLIKVKVIENFHLGRFAEIMNLQRATANNSSSYLYVGDTFECTEDMAKYLTNETPNPVGRKFVEVIETIPEKKEEIKKEPAKKTTTKKITKKTTTKKTVAKKK